MREVAHGLELFFKLVSGAEVLGLGMSKMARSGPKMVRSESGLVGHGLGLVGLV